jgi:acetyl esterase/lipase
MSQPVSERRAQVEQAMSGLPLADGVAVTPMDAAGVPVIECRPAGHRGTVLYFHGGGYRIGSARAWRSFGTHLASITRTRVLLVDYRLAPEHPFPAAVEDATAVYEWLCNGGEAGIVAGDSAGGGLAVMTNLVAKQRGLRLPMATIALSPWPDLTNSADSYQRNAAHDLLFSKEAADEGAAWYLAGADPRNPLASPVFGDLTGLGPMLIHVGGCEVLLDDAGQLAERARAAGVDVTYHVWPGRQHVFHLTYPADAAEAMQEIAEFVQQLPW